jgi:hypothetical protein
LYDKTVTTNFESLYFSYNKYRIILEHSRKHKKSYHGDFLPNPAYLNFTELNCANTRAKVKQTNYCKQNGTGSATVRG